MYFSVSSAGLLTLTPSTPIPFSLSFSNKRTIIVSSSISNNNNDNKTVPVVTFNYSRALSSIRRHNSDPSHIYPSTDTHFSQNDVFVQKTQTLETPDETHKRNDGEEEGEIMRDSRSKIKFRRMNKIDTRVKMLIKRILGLKSDEFVVDVLEQHRVMMTPVEFSYVLKSVGRTSWQRALELYELRAPNARMVSSILGVLGKANQEEIAVETFTKAESVIENNVHVYTAMMGVYARNDNFDKVKELFDLMREREVEPNIISLNTLIYAKVRSCAIVSGLAIQLLDEVVKFGLRPDIGTYKTLIRACSRRYHLKEAIVVFSDMETNGCQPNLQIYNDMISVYGRCGFALKAEHLFEELKSKGFSPDADTYNSLLYAFSKKGNAEKVRDICDEIVKMGFDKDKVTYSTILHMYGKQGQHDEALQLYREMNSSNRNLNMVRYTSMIDLFGEASKIEETAKVMSKMLNAGVMPSLHTYTVLICAYAKVGKRAEAEETFNRMCESNIKADRRLYSIMLCIFLRFNEIKKAMVMYQEMIQEGFKPENGLYEVMLPALVRENMGDVVERIVQDMEELSNMNPRDISSVLVKGGCYDHGAKMLKVAVSNGYELDREIFLSIISSYSSSARYSEACGLLEFFREHAPGDVQMITKALVIIVCKADV